MEDGCFVMNPDHSCAFCGEPFGIEDEREFVLVESGQMTPMRKDPHCLRFSADHSSEYDAKLRRHAVLEFYHADCFIDRFLRSEWGANSPTSCDLCGVDFRRVRWAFRVRLGRQDFETGIFVPLEDPRNETILCPECITEGFGEGDTEEGELLLGSVRR